MNLPAYLLRLAFVCCLLGSTDFLLAQQNNKEALMLRAVMEKNHYSPRKINDEFSRDVFHQFLLNLDRNNVYFLASDLKEFKAYEKLLDDEFNGKAGWRFLPLVTARYKQRLLNAQKIITTVIEKPFDYNFNETISFSDDDSLSFAADEKTHLLRWTKFLKYKTLWQLVNLSKDSTSNEKSVMAQEPSARQKVNLIEQRRIKKILENPNGFENYVSSIFFASITYCYDPHSVYMSKTDWENFEASLSKEALSFGMDLDENEAGDVFISRLVPGGPAWKSNELHKDDVLVQLKWNDKPALDLTGADAQEVESILETSNSKRLDITVRKTSGVLKTVSLMKEKLREDDQIVKSYILNGEKKIGYISLPGFYSEWENMSPLGCANDVAKEIIKLKEEKIEGLILDIRYNGGGSLMEGLNLAGIFINEGPLFMMQSRDLKPYVMKDMNRGTIYDGPLVLMVNGQSASASEVLASTLQDYNRALIVGSTTYGKATGQIVIPLDTTIKPETIETAGLKSPFGVASVTVKKLYRITGKSAQLKGVSPDVHLPDIYEVMDYRESSFPTALVSDSVTKKVTYSPLAPLPVKSVSEKSKERLNTDKDFILLKKLIASQAKMQNEMKNISLNYTLFRNTILSKYKEWELLTETEETKSKVYSVNNTSYDEQIMTVDTYCKEINAIQVKNIEEDLYIHETYRIITDLITH